MSGFDDSFVNYKKQNEKLANFCTDFVSGEFENDLTGGNEPNDQTQSLVPNENVPNWTPLLYIRLMQNFRLEKDIAVHLANSYGDEAFGVASLATVSGKRWAIVGRRLHPKYPYLEAELRFALRKNVFCTVVDFSPNKHYYLS